jgi:predicted DNA-binding protein YlxM (UPF0122 family)
MILGRKEKEKLVLELYYEKGYTYRDIAKELRMSPNQISDIIKGMRKRATPKQTTRRSYLYHPRLTYCFQKVKLIRRWQ